MVRWSAADPGLAAAVDAHGPMIAGEVLALSFTAGDGPGDSAGEHLGDGEGSGEAAEQRAAGPWHAYGDADLGLRFWLAVAG